MEDFPSITQMQGHLDGQSSFAEQPLFLQYNDSSNPSHLLGSSNSLRRHQDDQRANSQQSFSSSWLDMMQADIVSDLQTVSALGQPLPSDATAVPQYNSGIKLTQSNSYVLHPGLMGTG
jgi:hypothetical protein